MNNGRYWRDKETTDLINDFAEKPDDVSVRAFATKFGRRIGVSQNAVKGKLADLKAAGHLKRIVSQSPYPKYDAPLVMTGDALVLPDVEFPFHDADFINQVLDLTKAWGVRQLILAGDVLHFDSLSGWEPNWQGENSGGIMADAEEKLMDFAESLPSEAQGRMMELLGDIGQRAEGDGMSTEIGIARRELKRISEQFDRVDMILGNHCGRLLRALQTTLDPKELLRLLEAGDNWRIAEYYFSYLDTSKGRFMIEHPKGAAETTAQGLAAKFGVHVIMGHSHALDFSWDISGRYFAIQAGCCVDETRLPYAAQRHTTKRQHKLGAVLVVDGFPWLLHEHTDWDRMLRMA